MVCFVYVGGYVNVISGFLDSLVVINGVSDLFVVVFGEVGKYV